MIRYCYPSQYVALSTVIFDNADYQNKIYNKFRDIVNKDGGMMYHLTMMNDVLFDNDKCKQWRISIYWRFSTGNSTNVLQNLSNVESLNSYHH